MLRIGLGCMRLTREQAETAIPTALDAGITFFDTARAYGDSEEILGRLLAGRAARVITKGGMRREGGAWIPDGRASALRADCEASLCALDGVPIDLYLLHAPDPRTTWTTSVRGLVELVEAGLVPRIGLCNVNRRQLDEALAIAPIAAVEVALSVRELAPLRGGVVERCAERGITVLAHSPLGGPARASRLERDPSLVAVAARHGATAAQVALAWLLDLAPIVIPIPGARRPEHVRACAHAASIALDDDDRARLPSTTRRAPEELRDDGEVVLVMGIPGAGKTESVEKWQAAGYERLNRDERGGTLRALHGLLERRLASGVARVVLDNTYVTRATRREAIETAWRHRLPVRGVWLDTPLPDAQVNVVLRMLARHGRLLGPDEMAHARDPAAIPPRALFRAVRELEPPEENEGFRSLEVIRFVRRPRVGRGARLVAIEGARVGERADLLFGWRPEPNAGEIAAEIEALGIDAPVALCPHPGGPPICWCRPPLPGLALAFAAANGIDLGKSVLVGTSAAHRSMAAAIGAAYEHRSVNGRSGTRARRP